MDKECNKILNGPSDSSQDPGNKTTESSQPNIKQVIVLILRNEGRGRWIVNSTGTQSFKTRPLVA